MHLNLGHPIQSDQSSQPSGYRVSADRVKTRPVFSGFISVSSMVVDPDDNTKRTYKVKIGNQAIDLANVREVE